MLKTSKILVTGAKGFLGRHVCEELRLKGYSNIIECFQNFTLISTDKAVNPTSIMGASKRIAEMICQGLSLSSSRCRFVTVRFGNVLGSTGSVVPLFQRQLARKGPLTVTDAEVTRFFMTTREAVELILQATAATPTKLEVGKIFVLDMGKPVRILDLARQMIRLAGFTPEVDIPILFTGLRPGEKLHEELLHQAETPQPTKISGVTPTSDIELPDGK